MTPSINEDPITSPSVDMSTTLPAPLTLSSSQTTEIDDFSEPNILSNSSNTPALLNDPKATGEAQVAVTDFSSAAGLALEGNNPTENSVSAANKSSFEVRHSLSDVWILFHLFR